MPHAIPDDETFEARVGSVRLLTRSDAPEPVYEICLHVPETMELEPGLHLGVRVSDTGARGQDGHERLYTVVHTAGRDDAVEARLYVRRCKTTVEPDGRRSGRTSNWLCDRAPGDTVTVAGPYGTPFAVPADPAADLILIAQGTGIAAFQALLWDLDHASRPYSGSIRLYLAAPESLARVFHDSLNRHLSEQLRARLHHVPPVRTESEGAVHAGLIDDADILRPMLAAPHTHVYVAGLKILAAPLNAVFARLAGSEDRRQDLLKQLRRAGRWQELLY